MNTRESILTSNDRKTQKVETPEWTCGHVYVRSLSAAERRNLSATNAKANAAGNGQIVPGIVAAFIISDEAGNRIFTDDDAAALAEKNTHVLDRISEAYGKLNGLDPKDIRESEKN